MPECVLDANVLVALIDARDTLHSRAERLIGRLAHEGVDPILLDVAVNEAISVLCRRFEERRRGAEISAVLTELRTWLDASSITWVAAYAGQLFDEVLDVVASTQGRLNFNDALLVVLQRRTLIPAVATFDDDFDEVEGFRRTPEE